MLPDHDHVLEFCLNCGVLKGAGGPVGNECVSTYSGRLSSS